jgi:hypothetical protein
MGEAVTDAPGVVKVRAIKSIVLGLDSYEKTTSWSTGLWAFRVTRIWPYHSEAVLDHPDV